MSIGHIDTRPTPGQLAHETFFVGFGGTKEDAAAVWRSLSSKRRDVWEAIADRVICRFLADHLDVPDEYEREELERMLTEWSNDDTTEYRHVPLGEPVGHRSVVFTPLAPSQAAVDHAARLASAAIGEQDLADLKRGRAVRQTEEYIAAADMSGPFAAAIGEATEGEA